MLHSASVNVLSIIGYIHCTKCTCTIFQHKHIKQEIGSFLDCGITHSLFSHLLCGIRKRKESTKITHIRVQESLMFYCTITQFSRGLQQEDYNNTKYFV